MLFYPWQYLHSARCDQVRVDHLLSGISMQYTECLRAKCWFYVFKGLSGSKQREKQLSHRPSVPTTHCPTSIIWIAPRHRHNNSSHFVQNLNLKCLHLPATGGQAVSSFPHPSRTHTHTHTHSKSGATGFTSHCASGLESECSGRDSLLTHPSDSLPCHKRLPSTYIRIIFTYAYMCILFFGMKKITHFFCNRLCQLLPFCAVPETCRGEANAGSKWSQAGSCWGGGQAREKEPRKENKKGFIYL